MADNPTKGPEEREYIGNIWGWKFSLFSLGLILLLAGIMLYRHVSLGVPFGGPPREEAKEAPVDSLQSQSSDPHSDQK